MPTVADWVIRFSMKELGRNTVAESPDAITRKAGQDLDPPSGCQRAPRDCSALVNGCARDEDDLSMMMPTPDNSYDRPVAPATATRSRVSVDGVSVVSCQAGRPG